MKEREVNTGIWIHHIVTFIGLSCSIYRLGEKQIGKGRAFALIMFIGSQLWAVIKIIADLLSGGSRLKKSFERIHTCCQDRPKERKILAVLVAGSAFFKLGVPWVLGKKID